MIKSNFHTHTVFSDGKNTPREMIEAAIALGFDKIGISDHAYTEFYDGWSVPKARMEEYLQTLRDLKKEYADRISVYIGLEQDALAVPLPQGLDYCIGSVHWLAKNGHYIPLDESWQSLRDAIDQDYNGDADALAEDYFRLVASYAQDPAVQIIGHFDLITKFDEKSPPLFLSTPRYEAAWKAAATTLAEAGKIFEINTGAISRGKRITPYPSRPILAYLSKIGAKVTVNSDCHAADALDCAFDQAVTLVQEYNLTLTDLF